MRSAVSMHTNIYYAKNTRSD